MFGFVILTHRSPEQLRRLVLAINALYDDPPIACHHDFRQSSLDTSSFPANAHFVEPSLRTGWAKWSVVEATLAALRLLYRIADPEFALFVTGADYPTATKDRVMADLVASGADAFIDGYSIQNALAGSVDFADPLLANFRLPHNVRLAQKRYLRAQIRMPVPRRKDGGGWRLGAQTINFPFDAISNPFHSNYHCYFGAQFFTFRKSAAMRVLKPNNDDQRLFRHLRARIAPEEVCLQTVIHNDLMLKTDLLTRRYVDWSEGGAHPRNLADKDLPDILNGGYHFARKFVSDDPALDEIDRFLGISGALS